MTALTDILDDAAAEVCGECGCTPDSCLRAQIKCCPDCTHTGAALRAAAYAEGYEAGRADAGRDALNAAADALSASHAMSTSRGVVAQWLRARAEAVGDDRA